MKIVKNNGFSFVIAALAFCLMMTVSEAAAKKAEIIKVGNVTMSHEEAKILTGQKLNISFAKDKWNPAEWVTIKSPRWEHVGSWKQMDDHLLNNVPEDLDDEKLLSCPEAYAAIITKDKFALGKKLEISSEMSFDHRMAPLIVFADNYGISPKGIAEFHEHWEVVLWDQGINIWHHTYADGKPSWTLAAYITVPFKANTKYRLNLKITTGGKVPMLEVSCDGKVIGCALYGLKDAVHAGIIGCEGRNRFYDFTVKQ